ncbi:uncharacterized protein LOC119453409 [Dermacentor silvarum]|uniref:uncharacterized protein LOC119453409 n=1 Tax=Dermacentor silvarum TaxID=543639 RepID=UPI002101D20B|nr:uncharacterized protein LOC119453409 [Dermacentor silvarum]XP_049523076.1 uncharacterized protein LOC119453409 [Dermacentor silvarum]
MAPGLHEHNSQGWTRKARALNPFFAKEHIVRYTESKGALKHRGAGLRLFTSGHLQKLVFSTEDTAETIVKAQVLPSMTTRTAYSVGVKLLKCDGEVVSGNCSCVAGKGGVCKHVCCVLYGLMHIAQHDLTEVPDAVACTEGERQWYNPRDPKKVAEQFEQIVFSKDTTERISEAPRHHKKRAAYSSLRSEDQKLSTVSLINLHGKLKDSKLDCFADVLEANDFLPAKQRKVESPDPEDVSRLPVRWLERAKQGNALLPYTEEEVAAVEAATRLQSACLLWHRYREGVITASIAHRVHTWVRTCQTKMGPHDARPLTAAVMGAKKGRATFAMKRGLLCEPEARQAFRDQNDSHVELQVIETGLFLSRHHTFLGASPDGLVKCKCCPPRLLEIKVPLKVQDFARTQLHAGELKRSSRYYTQMQVQMGVTGLDTCVLFVYSKEECLQSVVPFEKSFFDEFVKRCEFFTTMYLLPHIASNC